MGNVTGSRAAPVPAGEATRRFSPRELEALRRGYDRLCHPSSSAAGISRAAFRDLVLADVPDVPEPLVQRMFTVFDTNRDGSLSFAELSAGLCVLCRGKFEERSRFLFAVYDKYEARALDRGTLEHFAEMLCDERLPQDARLCSSALVEDAFSGDGDAAGTEPLTVSLQRFQTCVARFMDAPLVSWPGMLGQRLLAPFFASADHIPSDNNNITMQPASPTTAALQRVAAPPRPATPLARQLSTQQQLSEGDAFRTVFAPPVGAALVEGDAWFLVSTAWFDRWRRFAGLASFDAGSGASVLDLAHLEVLPPPGPIDNAPLLRRGADAEADAFAPLRAGLVFRDDFVVLNAAAWELLHGAHGGGPAMARSVVAGERAGQTELELFPLQLSVRCATFGNTVSGAAADGARVVLSRRDSVRALACAISDAVLTEEDAALVAHMPADALRVWCVLGSLDAALDDAIAALGAERRAPSSPSGASASVKLLPDLESTLEDADLVDGRTVVLEVCGHDGRWPLASAETLRSLRPRESCSAAAARDASTNQLGAEGRAVLLGGGSGGNRKKQQAATTTTTLVSASSPPLPPSSSVPLGAVERGRMGSVMSARRAGPGARIPGNVGLCNLGNTCFMSASVQCLLHTQPLKQYLLDNAYVRDLNIDAREGSKGRLADAFAEVVRFAWGGAGGGGRALSPRRFKRELGRHDDRFAGTHQQDAQEMLSSLLDGLAQDLNRVHSKAYVELKDSDGRADEEVAREWWQAHLRRELSVVTALFTGQYKSLITCGECAYESARFEAFQTLSLSLPESPLRTVTVHVVFADAARPPLLVSVRVDKTGSFADVRKALLDMQPGAQGTAVDTLEGAEQERASRELVAERLVLAFVFNRLVHTLLPDDRRLASLRDRDPVYAFELPAVPSARDSDDDAASVEVGMQVCIATPGRGGGGKVDSDDGDGEGGGLPTMGIVTGTRGLTSKKQGAERRFEVTVDEGGRRERVMVVPESQLQPEALPAAVFKVEQREWHKHACYFLNPLRPATVGFPFLLRLRPDRVTGLELYEAVAAQLRAGADADPEAVGEPGAQAPDADAEQEASGEEGEAAEAGKTGRGLSDAEIRGKWGFKLVLLSARGGGTCGCCTWMKPCDGCALPPDNSLVSLRSHRAAALAVDWGLSREGGARGGRGGAAGVAPALTVDLVDQHESVEAARREEMKAMPLSSLLRNFVRTERLHGAEQVRCGKCKEFRDHDKKIELWRVPPVLVVHLKRFDGHRKLLNLVQFPLEQLDLRDFIAEAAPAKSKPARATTTSSADSTADSPKGAGDEDDAAQAAVEVPQQQEPPETEETTHVEKRKSDSSADAPQERSRRSRASSSDSSRSSGSSKSKSKAAEAKPAAPSLSPEDAAAQEQALHLAEEMMDSDFSGLRSYGGRAHGGIAPVYDLYGVVEHAGSLGGGHYIAKARSGVSNDWFVFDDATVQRIEPESVESSRAYLLFYVRRDLEADPDVHNVFPCEDMDPKEAARRVKELVPPPPSASACALM